MPRSTREWAQRKLREAVQSLDWVVYHLAEVGERYEPDHPEIAEQLLQGIAACNELETYITKIGKSF